MKRFVLAFVIAAVVMMALDAIWLTTMSPMIYKPMMGDMLRPQPDMVAAGLFYVLYVFGVVWLAVLPALSQRLGWGAVAFRSGLFGLVAYGTYDLTAQSVIAGWLWKLTAIDMAWGTFLTLVTGLATVFLLRAMGKAAGA
jgi:uncharacterized membrane protein